MNKAISYITLLTIIVIAASSFMVIESSKYYERFYQASSWEPLYLAALLESFVIILSIIKYGGIFFKSFQNIVMSCIFLVIVSSAAFNAVYPTLESMTKHNKSKELQELYNNKLNELREAKKIYSDSDKLRNYSAANVIGIKTYDALEDSLKSEQETTNVGFVALVNIWLFIIIRFLVQLANLICARTIGVIYRENLPLLEPKIRREIQNDLIKCKRNIETKEYEVLKNDVVVSSASTARDAWKKFKENTNV